MIIYKTTNLINGKIYVGKDSNDNPSYLGSGKLLRYAVNKYGKENFKKEVLEACDLSNINEREVFWIELLRSRNKKIGYNVLTGGEGFGCGKDNPFFGKYRSSETKRKIADWNRGRKRNRATRLAISMGMRGRKYSNAYKKKMSNSIRTSIKFRKSHTSKDFKEKMRKLKIGKNNHFFGQHLTKEHRKKISKALYGQTAHNKGVRHSKEQCEKMSKALMGRKVSTKTRLKIAKALTGIKRSLETRRKISLSKTKTK